jgi:CBS domain-containing protein
MSRDGAVASPTESMRNVAKVTAKIDAGALPVGENDRLVGMITDRDIALRAVAQGKAPTTKVRDIMSEEVLYCCDEQDLDEVAQTMSDMKIRRLPVVNPEKRLVGIISLGNLARNEDADKTGETVSHICEPGGHHSQTAH